MTKTYTTISEEYLDNLADFKQSAEALQTYQADVNHKIRSMAPYLKEVAGELGNIAYKYASQWHRTSKNPFPYIVSFRHVNWCSFALDAKGLGVTFTVVDEWGKSSLLVTWGQLEDLPTFYKNYEKEIRRAITRNEGFKKAEEDNLKQLNALKARVAVLEKEVKDSFLDSFKESFINGFLNLTQRGSATFASTPELAKLVLDIVEYFLKEGDSYIFCLSSEDGYDYSHFTLSVWSDPYSDSLGESVGKAIDYFEGLIGLLPEMFFLIKGAGNPPC